MSRISIARVWLALCLFAGAALAQDLLNQGVGATSTAPVRPHTSADNTAAKKPLKARKVYTNDDFGEGGESSPYSREPAELVEEANQCDRNCFNRAGGEMKIPNVGGSKWKRDLMTALDEVRSDGPWQRFLLELARMRGTYCQLAGEKQEELSRLPDRQQVSEREGSIDEKYEKKYADANAELIMLYQRMGKYRTGDHIRDGFMDFQVQRLMTSNCLVPVPYQEPEPADPEDP